MFPRAFVLSAGLGLVSVLAGCFTSPSDPTNDPENVDLLVTAAVTSVVAVVVVEVTAPDIETPLAFNLDVVDGTASGTITVPAGSDRTFTVTASDAKGIDTHQGSATADVSPGENAPIQITLLPLVGDQVINVVIASLTVTITPSSATIGIGETVTLTAQVQDPDGPVEATVSWASLAPGIATVDSDGIVTGHAAGDAQVVATYAGVGGSATITVLSDNPAALSFDGVTQFVEVADADDLDLSTEWTIEAWIKPGTVSGGFQHIVSKWGGCSVASYSMELNGAKLRNGIASCANGTQVTESISDLVVDQWQHVAVTLSGGTLRLFINGTEDNMATGSQAPLPTTTAVSIGRQSGGGLAYNGLIDELRIWNVARTEGELQAAMNIGLAGTETGLVGYWRFDEGTGDTAADATGNGHAGRLGTSVGPDTDDPDWTTDTPPVIAN